MYICLYWFRVRADEDVKSLIFRDLFPYEMLAIAMIELIAWGSVSFIVDNFIIESAYYIILIGVVAIALIYAVMLWLFLHIKIENKDVFKVVLLVFLMVTALMIVNYRITLLPSTNIGNVFGIIVSGLCLLGTITVTIVLAFKD